MRRLLLAGAFVLAAMGHAHAGGTRKVKIDSEPSGASVYIGDVDSGVACEPTPCMINAPIGSATIIIRMDKYEPEIAELDVPKGKSPLTQKYKLKSAVGTIKVDTPKGATVRIDDEDKGKAPVEISSSASDPHHVVVSLNGKTVFDDIVEINTGEEFVVKPKMASTNVDDTATVTDDTDGEGGGGGGGSGGGSGGSTGISGSSDGTPRMAYVSVGAAFDVGFRHFTYNNAMTNNLREETEGGQIMGGLAVELWPGRMIGVKPLRGLSLYGRAQFPVAGQTVQGGDLMGTVKTKWSSFEGSLRFRAMFGSLGIEASGGYVQDQMGFDTTVGQDINLMPAVNYQSVRLGAKAIYATDKFEPYLAAETRIVMSGGPVGERFDTAKAGGLRGAIGATVKLGAISLRGEGSLTSYSWDFTYDNLNDTAQATGATDFVKLISANVNYSY
ncbi:MAG TPA: PEGA domain-containing protein [Kofleriaceae bacterium]|nr:PEGA domain-containing protein [Kofleriaceae bacterium]